MNKQYLSGFAAILIALLIIAPGIAGAAPKIGCTVTGGYENVTACHAKSILEDKGAFLLDVRTPAEYSYSHIEGATLIPLKNVPSHVENSVKYDFFCVFFSSSQKANLSFLLMQSFCVKIYVFH